MQGEGDVGEYEPEMVVVGEVSMSITMAELTLREEMKNETNSCEVQRTVPIQLKVHGLFLEASLSVCSNHRNLFFNLYMFIELLPPQSNECCSIIFFFLK